MQPSDEIVDYGYLDDMGRDVTQLQEQLRLLEKTVYHTSSRDGQFSHITVDEVITFNNATVMTLMTANLMDDLITSACPYYHSTLCSILLDANPVPIRL